MVFKMKKYLLLSFILLVSCVNPKAENYQIVGLNDLVSHNKDEISVQLDHISDGMMWVKADSNVTLKCFAKEKSCKQAITMLKKTKANYKVISSGDNMMIVTNSKSTIRPCDTSDIGCVSASNSSNMIKTLK
jgi:hypothetical protein